MRVTIAELQQATNIVFKHLQDSGVNDFELSEDLYWDIPYDQIHDMTTEPTNLIIGQLFDDLEAIRSIVKGEKEPIAYDLVYLSAILRTIGDTVVS